MKGVFFKPFSSTFTTGTLNANTGPVAFSQTVVDTGQKFTSVAIGPDGKLYASTAFGLIYRYKIESDGSLTQEKVISTVRSANGNTDRTVIGLAFDPSATADNLTLWVSDNPTYKGPFVDDWTGKIARLTGADLANYQAVVVGLPRSVRDHETNSVAFGPDGALYVTQGSNNAMGAPDAAWGNRPERVLSAAVLRLELGKLPANLPIDVKTEEGGVYNPFALNAPLTIYASGVRNAYDLVLALQRPPLRTHQRLRPRRQRARHPRHAPRGLPKPHRRGPLRRLYPNRYPRHHQQLGAGDRLPL